MTSIIRIFNNKNKLIRILRGIASVEQIFNQMDRATISISTSSESLSAELFFPGNSIVIDRVGVRPWAGILVPPNQYTRDTITIEAVSPEVLLKGRTIDVSPRGKGLTPGRLVQYIISKVNKIKKTSIVADKKFITKKGGVITDLDSYVGRDALQSIRGIANQYGYSFWFTHEVTNNSKLQHFFHWQRRRRIKQDAHIYVGHGAELSASIVSDGRLVTLLHITEDTSGEPNVVKTFDYEKLQDKFGIHGMIVRKEEVGRSQRRIKRFMSMINRRKYDTRVPLVFPIASGDETKRTYKIVQRMRPGNVHKIWIPNVGISNSSSGFAQRMVADSMRVDGTTSEMQVIFRSYKRDDLVVDAINELKDSGTEVEN